MRHVLSTFFAMTSDLACMEQNSMTEELWVESAITLVHRPSIMSWHSIPAYLFNEIFQQVPNVSLSPTYPVTLSSWQIAKSVKKLCIERYCSAVVREFIVFNYILQFLSWKWKWWRWVKSVGKGVLHSKIRLWKRCERNKPNCSNLYKTEINSFYKQSYKMKHDLQTFIRKVPVQERIDITILEYIIIVCSKWKLKIKQHIMWKRTKSENTV